MQAPNDLALTIDGPEGELELRVTEAVAARAVAVICHPHPLYGGSLDNKVVHTLMRAARDQGATVVRFNFRGVGGSQGLHDDGRGEVDDCLAAIAWAEQRYALPVWLMGFSFGGYVAAAAAKRLPVYPQRLVLVAPSVERLPFADLLPLDGECAVCMGDADDVVAPEAVFSLLEDQPGIDLRRFAGAGHFFHGRLVDLKNVVEELLSGT